MNFVKKICILNKEIETILNSIYIAELKQDIESKNELLEIKKTKEQERELLIKKISDIQNKNEIIKDKIFNDDILNVLPLLKSNSIDLFLSDIPYGINLDEWDVFHNNTNSAFLKSNENQNHKSGFKKRGKPLNGWNKEDRYNNKHYEEWCFEWGQSLYTSMKEGASVLIFGGRRTIHSAISGLETAGFICKDILAWDKPYAHHKCQSLYKVLVRRGEFMIDSVCIKNLKSILEENSIQGLDILKNKKFNNVRSFTAEIKKIITDKDYKKHLYDILLHANQNEEVKSQIKEWTGWKVGNLAPKYEPIAWLFKPYSSSSLTDNIIINKVGAINIDECKINGKEPTNLITFGFTSEEIKNRIHEAQKPIELMEYLIKLTTKEGQIVFDGFMGSGSTIVAAKNTKRSYIGIERDTNMFNKAQKRILKSEK